MVEIYYIPGLNNYGDDRVHIGPLKFFRMHEVLDQHLGKYGIKLVPLYPNKESLPKKIEALAHKIKTLNNVTLLGHSTGGIMARALLSRPELKKNISGVITFGCPHRGSHLADLTAKLNQNRGGRLALLKFFGYDVRKNLEFILDLSTENLIKIFGDDASSDVPSYSLVCSKEIGKMPMAFRMLYSYSGEKINFASDGIVSKDSQNWGRTLGPFDLDHLAQIGFFKHLVNPKLKRQTLAEFDRLIKTMADTVREINSK
jgi:hypothetical protein